MQGPRTTDRQRVAKADIVEDVEHRRPEQPDLSRPMGYRGDVQAQRAGNGEHLAPLEVQLDWLRECGFVNVECFLKVLELAVFGGQRGGGGE